MDQDLVERAQRGDRDAYERLARASADRLYAVAYQIARDPDAADDAVQQTLVSIWREIPSLRDPSRFEGWTYRLVTRACLQELRRQRRHHVGSVTVDDEATRAAGDVAMSTAIRDQVERGLAALKPDHRAVVVLRHFVGLQIEEIAETLGIPAGTVASRLHHAKRLLRAAIDADERQPLRGGQPA